MSAAVMPMPSRAASVASTNGDDEFMLVDRPSSPDGGDSLVQEHKAVKQEQEQEPLAPKAKRAEYGIQYDPASTGVVKTLSIALSLELAPKDKAPPLQLNIAAALDTSGSMNRNGGYAGCQRMLTDLQRLITIADKGNCTVSIVPYAFDTKARYFEIDGGQFCTNLAVDKFDDAIAGKLAAAYTSFGGSTNHEDACEFGVAHLMRTFSTMSAETKASTAGIVLLATDGAFTAWNTRKGSVAATRGVAAAAAHLNCLVETKATDVAIGVSTIAIGSGCDAGFLKKVAGDRGTSAVAHMPDDVDEAVLMIFNQLGGVRGLFTVNCEVRRSDAPGDASTPTKMIWSKTIHNGFLTDSNKTATLQLSEQDLPEGGLRPGDLLSIGIAHNYDSATGQWGCSFTHTIGESPASTNEELFKALGPDGPAAQMKRLAQEFFDKSPNMTASETIARGAELVSISRSMTAPPEVTRELERASQGYYRSLGAMAAQEKAVPPYVTTNPSPVYDPSDDEAHFRSLSGEPSDDSCSKRNSASQDGPGRGRRRTDVAPPGPIAPTRAVSVQHAVLEAMSQARMASQ